MGRRAGLTLALVLGALFSATLPLAVGWPAQAASADDVEAESAFLALISAERAAAGQPGLATADDLTAVARRHAESMASQSRLHHNPNLATEVDGWLIVGENVGQGPAVTDIHLGLMESPGHRREILKPDFTDVGVGVVVEGPGVLWVSQVFRKPGGAPAAEPATQSEPARRSEPALRLKPAPTTTPVPLPLPAPDPAPERVAAPAPPPEEAAMARAELASAVPVALATDLPGNDVNGWLAAAAGLLLMVVVAGLARHVVV